MTRSVREDLSVIGWPCQHLRLRVGLSRWINRLAIDEFRCHKNERPANPMRPLFLFITLVSTQFLCGYFAEVASGQQLAIASREDRLIIRHGETEIAHYIFRDRTIPRPYFAHVKTPGGTQATRSHPPVKGKDATDHAAMHPGIWMAFGDLNGEDFWRNKASIEHVKFVEAPRGGYRSATFVEEKRYVSAEGHEVCRELFRWKLHAFESGFLMDWDSTFTSGREFYFGDQEEMGLGIRVATPMAEKNGGLLRDSAGRRNASQIWSQAARWCDYSGAIDDRTVGVTLLCHPDNFRPSWMHARDYGFLAANTFGRKTMKQGDESKLIIKPGESLQLRYGVWIYSAPRGTDVDTESVYRRYVKLSD